MAVANLWQNFRLCMMEPFKKILSDYYKEAEDLLCIADFAGAFSGYLKSLECLKLEDFSVFSPLIINGLEVLTEILSSERWKRDENKVDAESIKAPFLWCMEKLLKIGDKLHRRGRFRYATQAFDTAGNFCDRFLFTLNYHPDPVSAIAYPMHGKECMTCTVAQKVFLRHAEVYFCQSNIMAKLNNYKAAIKAACGGYQIATSIDTSDLKIKGLFTLAFIYRLQGDCKKAISLSTVACDIFTDLINSIDDKKRLSSLKLLCFHGLRNLSVAHRELENKNQAIASANACLDVVSAIDGEELCRLYKYIGRLYMSSEKKMLKDASQIFQSLVFVCKKFGELETLADAYSQLCSLHLSLGHRNLSFSFARYTLLLGKKFSNSVIESKAYGLLAMHMEKQRKYGHALELYQKQLSTATGNNMLDVCCLSYLSLGRTFYNLRSFNNAKFFLQHGLERSYSLPYRDHFSKAELLLAKVLKTLGLFLESYDVLRRIVVRLERVLSDNLESVISNVPALHLLKKVYSKLIIILVKLERYEDAFEINEYRNARDFNRMVDFKETRKSSRMDMEVFDYIPPNSTVLYLSLCGPNFYLWVIKPNKGLTKFYKKRFKSTSFIHGVIRDCLSSLALSSKGSNCCHESENRMFYRRPHTAERKKRLGDYGKKLDQFPDGQSSNLILFRLFNMLLGPVDHLLRELDEDSCLYVITQDVLSVIPFHLLVRRDSSHLFSKLDIIYLPCLAVLKEVHSRKMSACQTAVVAGNPILNKTGLTHSSGRNVHSRAVEMSKEMHIVSSILGVKHVEEGEVSKDTILQRLVQADVIHFVTIGNVADGCLVFTPNWDHKHKIAEEESFLIRAEDFLLLKLRAKLVFLSSGQECIQGLQARFSFSVELISCLLAAGAACVVACKWAMPFDCYQIILHKFYRSLEKGLTVARSLNRVCLEMESEHPEMHPGYWGGLVVFGIDVSIDIKTIKEASIQSRCKDRMLGKESFLGRETVQEDTVSKRSDFQRHLASVLHHPKVSEMLKLLNDLICAALWEKEVFYEHSMKNAVKTKVKCNTKFVKVDGFRSLLQFLGFQFHVDMERPEDSIVLLPLWNFDSILDITHQSLLATIDIQLKSTDVLYAIYRLLLRGDRVILETLQEIILLTLNTEIFMMSVEDKRVVLAWRNQEAKVFLQSVGLYCVGDSLLFHRRPINIELLKSAEKLLLSILELYRKDEDEQATMASLKIDHSSPALDLVSWNKRILTPSEMEQKRTVLERMKKINEEYGNFQKDGKQMA